MSCLNSILRFPRIDVKADALTKIQMPEVRHIVGIDSFKSLNPLVAQHRRLPFLVDKTSTLPLILMVMIILFKPSFY